MNQFDFPDITVYPINPETTYLVVNKQTNAVIIIDPTKKSIKAIIEFKNKGFFKNKPVYVWITHPHNDHFDGLDELREILDVYVICHQKFAALKQLLDKLSGKAIEINKNAPINSLYNKYGIPDLKKSPTLIFIDYLMERFPSNMPFSGDILAAWAYEFMKLEIDMFMPDGKLANWPMEILSFEGHSLIDCILCGNGFAFIGDIVFCDNNEILFGRFDLPGSDRKKFFSKELPAIIKLASQKPILFPGHHQPFPSIKWLALLKEFLQEQSSESE